MRGNFIRCFVALSILTVKLNAFAVDPQCILRLSFEPTTTSTESVVLPTSKFPKVDDPDLATLQTDSSERESCELASVCKTGEPTPAAFKFVYGFVLRTAQEFKESFFALSGKNLRSNSVAFADFAKNMAIIWSAQILGAEKLNGSLSFKGPLSFLGSAALGLRGLTSSQLAVIENTALMVWTQSDRGAGTTKKVDLPKARSFSELANIMKLAYKGEKGFGSEVKDRLLGFLSLIPFEIANLSIVMSLVAVLPHGAGFLSHDHITSMKSFSTFAVLFGTYLSFKWALVSKVFDLRALPVIREWMSARWMDAKAREGLWIQLDAVDRNGNPGADQVTLPGLIFGDFFRFIRGREFKCNMNSECQFTTVELPVSERSASVQYRRRWSGYVSRFPDLVAQAGVQGSISHFVGLPIEMTYRYGNTLIDSYFAMWLAAEGAPRLAKLLF